jgi:hypothetical protein
MISWRCSDHRSLALQKEKTALLQSSLFHENMRFWFKTVN